MKSNIDYLFSIESKGIKLGLERTKSLLLACNNPQKNLPVIQVAGTNGKGSTSAMIANIIRVAGLKVGLFTSPHLVNVNERIRINGHSISNDTINRFIEIYKYDIKLIDSSFFEVVTTMAFWYFNNNNVDIAVMETGLGGRLDSVTCCEPILSVITSISLDHMEILGDTINKIAIEKAGIIKKNVPCVMMHNECEEIFENRAKDVNTKIFYTNPKIKNEFLPNLKGKCHYQNAQLASLAIATINHKLITQKHIKLGIETVKWHGRNQIINRNPLVIFDVAHNEGGINSFLDYFNSIKHKGKKILIISIQKRKNIISCVNKLKKSFDLIICTQTNNVRTMNVNDLSEIFNHDCEIFENANNAIGNILARIDNKDSVGIIGTHYLGEPIMSNFNISFNSI